MAVTTENSTQYGYQISIPPTQMESNVFNGKLRMFKVEFTQGAAAGDATSVARMLKLPAGKVTLMAGLSQLKVSALGASRTFDFGWEAYQDQDGTAVTADPNGVTDGVDVSAAATVTLGNQLANGTYTFESRGGVVLAAQINDGTIPAAATIKGFIVVVVE